MGRGVVSAAVAVLASAGSAVAQAPAAPLVDAVQSATDVRLVWQADPAALGYRVYRTADLAQPFVAIGQVAAPAYVDPGVIGSPPDRLYYQVRGENASGLGPGSNLAFKLSLTLDCASDACAVSVPYRFWPNGSVGTAQTTRDLCALSPAIARLRFLRDSGGGCRIYRNWTCGSPVPPFNLMPPEAYLLLSDPGSPPFVLHLVGAHDPAHEPGGASALSLTACPSCFAQENLVSIPYHAVASRASELCAELAAAGQDILSVGQFSYLPRPLHHFCAAAIGDFDLQPGTAYLLTTAADRSWQPAVR